MGGVVVATDGTGDTTRTAVMWVNETEHHALTIVGIDRTGALGGWDDAIGITRLGNQDLNEFSFEQIFPFFDETGTATVRVPPGPYGVVGVLAVEGDMDQPVRAADAVSEPQVEVDGPTTVTLDATGYVPVEITTHKPAVAVNREIILTRDGDNVGTTLMYGVGPAEVGGVPSEAATTGIFSFAHRHTLLPPGMDWMSGLGRYLYDLHYVESVAIPAELTYAATAETTTRVRADYDAMAGRSAHRILLPDRPGPGEQVGPGHRSPGAGAGRAGRVRQRRPRGRLERRCRPLPGSRDAGGPSLGDPPGWHGP